MARTIDLNVTTYWWIAGDAGIANPDAISAAVLTAAKNISQYVHASTSIAPASSATVQDKGITDTANIDTPVIGNYGGTLVMFRDLAAGVASANDPLTVIGNAAGVIGWIVRREGFVSSADAAATQKVDAFKFAIDTPQKSGGTGTGMLKVTFPLLQQGVMRIETALVA